MTDYLAMRVYLRIASLGMGLWLVACTGDFVVAENDGAVVDRALDEAEQTDTSPPTDQQTSPDGSSPPQPVLDGRGCRTYFEAIAFEDEFSAELIANTDWESLGPIRPEGGYAVFAPSDEGTSFLRTRAPIGLDAICVVVEAEVRPGAEVSAQLSVSLPDQRTEASLVLSLFPGSRSMQLRRVDAGGAIETLGASGVDWAPRVTVMLRRDGARWVGEVEAEDEVFLVSGEARLDDERPLRLSTFGFFESSGVEVRWDRVVAGQLR